MVAKYYVAIRPQTNEYHAVHKENCPFLPDDAKRIYLGMFSSGTDALKEGRRHFAMADSCRFCSKENHPLKKKRELSGKDLNEVILPMNMLSLFQKSKMYFSLN